MNNNQVYDENKYYSHVLINYIIICIILIALSFIGLICFKEWVVPVCVTECSIFGLLVMALHIKGYRNMSNESEKGSFVIYLLLRYACMIIGIVVEALIIKFTMGEVVDKMRYLIVLVGAIPYFVPTISLLITKQVE